MPTDSDSHSDLVSACQSQQRHWSLWPALRRSVSPIATQPPLPTQDYSASSQLFREDWISYPFRTVTHKWSWTRRRWEYLRWTDRAQSWRLKLSATGKLAIGPVRIDASNACPGARPQHNKQRGCDSFHGRARLTADIANFNDLQARSTLW